MLLMPMLVYDKPDLTGAKKKSWTRLENVCESE